MSNQWLRAFRSAALNPRLPVAAGAGAGARSAARFHSSAPGRGPRDDDNVNNNNHDASRDNDARKPEDGSASSEAGRTASSEETEAVEDNFLGDDNPALASGEGGNGDGNGNGGNGNSQGRKKPATGMRARTQRNRKSDLPPVQIPKSFFGVALYRQGEGRGTTTATTATATSTKEEKEEKEEGNRGGGVEGENGGNGNGKGEGKRPRLRRDAILLNSASLTDEGLKEAMAALRLRSGGADDAGASEGADNIDTTIESISQRLHSLGVIMYLLTLRYVKAAHGHEAFAKILASVTPPRSLDYVASLLSQLRQATVEACGHDSGELASAFSVETLLLHDVAEDAGVLLRKASLFEPCMVDELATTLRAEFFIRAPEGGRLANVRRPATIINVQDCSGFSVAQDILQLVAEELGADVLHLRAHDIAHIVGRYIGQDVTRTLGDITTLGYRAAENSGRLKPRPTVEDDNDNADSLDLPYTVVLRDEKVRRDPKRQTISMEEFLSNSGTRGKSDELWEDMKVNAALDELIHSADTELPEQRSLIIHLHDFTALYMDETGAAIISKIRKAVDELWLSGRKVVLVGSCSTHDTPKPYQTALRGLEISERVIHLSKRYFANSHVRKRREAKLALWEKQDYLRENDENIVRMLWSMTESGDHMSTHTAGTLGLVKYAGPGLQMDTEPFAKYWDSVLPLAEVYRAATTMIGLSSSTGTTELFSLDCFERAVAKMSAVDEAREVAAVRAKATTNSKADSKGDNRKVDLLAENHEERLMSGMIHARDMRTSFKDIHAPQETIESIKMLTTLSLVRPEAFSYGVLASDRIPGCLLYGPPGTGKTLLAKAVAKESGANMIEVSGASINNMYVGESEKNVRALFRLAKKKEPMVIFIDEADALLGARGGFHNGARRETINQFLREWDGMDQMKAFIMVATNRPFDLDEAVLRRLPRKLLIDLPLVADRAAILKIHLKDEVMDETVSIEDIAKRTPLYSGSDLKNVCVAAAMAAVKEELEASERHSGPEPYKWAEKRVLSRRHFDKALKEIGASVSEDMATLTAIRKFDERYGDSKARRKRKGMGFEVIPDAVDSEQARVRGGR